ncbi:hypothetical protein BT96DRAFT_427422 [Gymnopus androsaceus JB14]|uniref:Uncharacterized protein n=1 Tax=Gymnopus androsaceus JB14 TaxID=1447944 RepID=A0A6A4I0Z2_9AGAR|nr:hypothetical protein BT96DRAFT_427422 [Gymnopus androsaceus JB14]
MSSHPNSSYEIDADKRQALQDFTEQRTAKMYHRFEWHRFQHAVKLLSLCPRFFPVISSSCIGPLTITTAVTLIDSLTVRKRV